MGMKLKSGADLCGFELSRFCVQNDVAIPDAPASGRKYFHTGTGMEGKYSLLGRERIFTGTSWRAAAYVDDLANLDLATNEDYLKLKKQVDLLSGEVDTDAIINNMKDVENFLAGFNESGGTLMSYLNTELGKKFDKAGGTITSNSYDIVTFDTTYSGGEARLALKKNGEYKSLFGWTSQNGTMMYNMINGYYICITDSGVPQFNNNTLIHSGNIGDYALKIDGSNAMTSNLRLNGGYLRFLSADGSTEYGAYNVNAGNNAPIYLYNGSWKTIAFVDSTVSAANRLITPEGIPYCYYVDESAVVFGSNVKDSFIDGNSITFRNSSYNQVMLVNASGNVGIGTTDPLAKLSVDGNLDILGSISRGNGGVLSINRKSNTGGLYDGNYDGWTIANMNGLIFFAESTSGSSKEVLKLSSTGNAHIEGDFTANGTIACKGVASEGSAPVGTVDKWAGSIATGTKSQTYTHGLGTTDITVAIYEKNGNEWVQILTDVDIVNANTIRVTFGANTTVEHRVVVMG